MARSAKIDKAGTDWAAILLGLGLGLTLALEMTTVRAADYADTYSLIALIARICALIGTYLALIGVLLVARIPWVERGVGHDRLVIWHRKLAPYSVFLIGFHVLFVIISFSGLEQVPLYKEIWRMVVDYPWVLWGFVGFVLMVAAGVTSYKKARAKMKYETWWLIHILTYGAIAAAFMHQIQNGSMFINHPLNKIYWIGLYIFVAFSILVWRIGIPVWQSLRHDLKVDRVVIEGMVDATMRDVHTVELAATGALKGTAEVEDAEISGTFEGDLTVRGKLTIHASGRVRGNVTYGEIEIQRGGQISGNVRNAADAKTASMPNKAKAA